MHFLCSFGLHKDRQVSKGIFLDRLKATLFEFRPDILEFSGALTCPIELDELVAKEKVPTRKFLRLVNAYTSKSTLFE